MVVSHKTTRRGRAGVAGVRRAGWLDEQQMHFFAGNRPMFDTFRDDE
jgi:hypothetical protein